MTKKSYDQDRQKALIYISKKLKNIYTVNLHEDCITILDDEMHIKRFHFDSSGYFYNHERNRVLVYIENNLKHINKITVREHCVSIMKDNGHVVMFKFKD